MEGLPCLSGFRARVSAVSASSDYGELGLAIQEFTACGAGFGSYVGVSGQHFLLGVSQVNRL